MSISFVVHENLSMNQKAYTRLSDKHLSKVIGYNFPNQISFSKNEMF